MDVLHSHSWSRSSKQSVVPNHTCVSAFSLRSIRKNAPAIQDVRVKHQLSSYLRTCPQRWEQLIGSDVGGIISCVSAIWQRGYEEYGWGGPFPPSASSGPSASAPCGSSVRSLPVPAAVWWTACVWVSAKTTHEAAVLISASLASILGPDALKGDQACALFTFPVCRYAATCALLEPFLDLYSKSNAAGSVRARGKRHYCWENWKMWPVWSKVLALLKKVHTLHRTESDRYTR